jgi:hypothetical protein
MGEANDSAPFERFNIDVNLLLIPGILLVIFVGKDLVHKCHVSFEINI